MRTRKLRTSETPLIPRATRQLIFGFSSGRSIVESELALDGTQIAEDLSKLRMGTSCHKLLIAAQTAQANPKQWIEFIHRIAANMTGEFFLALMPTYASAQAGSAHWWNRDAAIDLHRCPADGEVLQLVGCPITALRRQKSD